MSRFLTDGDIASDTVRTIVSESWRRCQLAGVDAERSLRVDPLAASDSPGRPQVARELLDASWPIMTEAHKFLSESNTIMILTDQHGVVLEVAGDADDVDAAAAAGLSIGSDWSEHARGTNAIGTTLILGEPVHIHGVEHYCRGSRGSTCSGAIVRDPTTRAAVAVVSVAGPDHTYNRHQLALAVTAAGRIEASLAGRETQLRERLLDHALGRMSQSASHGLIAFDRKGYFVTADGRARPSLTAMGVAPELGEGVRIRSLDLTEVDAGSPSSLPEWLDDKWLESVTVNGEGIGTLVMLPETIQRTVVVSEGGLPRYQLRRAVEFIDANIGHAIRIDEVARTVGVSRFHFHRLFRKSTGLTPHQFIVQRRIARARELLSTSKLPIVDVGGRVGFADQSHFTTTFRRITSMTPKTYRDSAQA